MRQEREHVCPLFSETAFVVEELKFITGQECCLSWRAKQKKVNLKPLKMFRFFFFSDSHQSLQMGVLDPGSLLKWSQQSPQSQNLAFVDFLFTCSPHEALD